MLEFGLCVEVWSKVLTARDDLTPWRWKKTLPASSGHTVLISSLDIPSSSFPLKTPRLETVLSVEMKTNNKPAFCWELTNRINILKLEKCSHILEKPLYSSHAFTSAGLELMFRVAGPRLSHWEADWREQTRMNACTASLSRATFHLAHRPILRRSSAVNRLQNIRWNVAFLVTGVAHKPPWPGFLYHLWERVKSATWMSDRPDWALQIQINT